MLRSLILANISQAVQPTRQPKALRQKSSKHECCLHVLANPTRQATDKLNIASIQRHSKPPSRRKTFDKDIQKHLFVTFIKHSIAEGQQINGRLGQLGHQTCDPSLRKVFFVASRCCFEALLWPAKPSQMRFLSTKNTLRVVAFCFLAGRC